MVLNACEHKVVAEHTSRLLQLQTLAADPHGLTLSLFPQLSTCFSPLSCIQLMFSSLRTETTHTSLQESHRSVFPLIIPEGTAVTVIRWWALLPLAQSPLSERKAACVSLWVWGSFTSVFVGTKCLHNNNGSEKPFRILLYYFRHLQSKLDIAINWTETKGYATVTHCQDYLVLL